MNRRGVIAAIGTCAMVLAIAGVGMAATADDDGDRYPMRGMMSGPSWDGSRGPDGWTAGRMTGTRVHDEFGYLTEMVAHHQEAVTAAQELARSNRPELREFGAGIVATQSAQIEQMQGWLAQWYRGRSTDADYQPMMRDLSRMSGDRLDRTFLVDMISHHMVAVMMSHQLLVRGLADHDDVDELAQSIRREQHAEILRMRHWLAAWFGTG